MKHNEIILTNQAHPRLTAANITSSGNGTSMVYIDTGPGYIELGPANSAHCHIQTDRSNFYFNKELRVDSGVVGSYDEDLYLRRATNSSHQIQISTSQVTSTLGITAPDATLGNTSTGAGALRLYDTGNNSLLFSGTGSNAFRMDMDGTSAIGTLTMSDFDIHMSTGNLTRGQHHTGHFEGSYNNIGANGYKSNPIYTIGSSYNPNDADLNNMYGIGFTKANQATFISMGGANNWGMYAASGGVARVFLDAANGHVVSSGEHYAGGGSAAEPAYSFNNDTNTGMYRYTTDQIGFATAGTHRMSIDSTGLRLSTGVYIAPSSTETTDLKSATSTNFLRFKNSSNTIHGGVYGTGTEIGLLDKDGQWAIRHAADSHTYFYINNSERVHIDNQGLDIVQGSLMMSGQHAMREATYSGTGNIGASGSWYTLCYITENATPAYISLKFSAHSTQTFVVTTGYHGSNVASIQMLSGTWTQNGGYPGASAVRVLKDSNNNYRFQLQLTYSSGPTAFTLYARAWGGTPVNDIVNFESSLTVDTTTGSTIDSLNTSFTGSGSSRAHRGANGSAGLPAYTFHEDPDTGMYLNGTGNIGFSSAGTTRAQLSSSKFTALGGTGIDLQTSSGNVRGLLVASETAPHLRIATSGNESIGFYDGGTDGTENIRIDGAGNLDLKTATLQLRGDVALDHDGNALYIKAPTTIYFYPGNANQGNLNTSGVLNLKAYQVNGTTVISSSRVLQNVTADASIITSGTIAEARLPTQSKYLRSDANDTASGIITFSSGSNSTSTSTGAVRITGGLGVGYNIHAGGVVRCNSGFQVNTTTIMNSSRVLQNTTLGYGPTGTRFQVGGWIDSTDGDDRFYFASESHTYYKAGGNSGKHIWRNGLDSSKAELDASGNFIATGNITAYGSASDIRIKENIESIPDSVEKVKSLRGVTFNYKKDGKRSTGLIAQELQKVLPEAVYETKDSAEDGEDILAIRYGNVVGLLVEALKEQQTQIDNLTSLVNQLKEK